MSGAGAGALAPLGEGEGLGVGVIGANGTSASAAQAAWARVRQGLRLSAGARLFDQWLKPIALVETGDPDVIRLTLPSAFMTNWVKSHYADRLYHEFRAILPNVTKVAIETASTTATVVEVLTPGPVKADAPDAASRPRPVLDTRYTFERFCVDASNRVAFNAAKALAQPGPPRFSPLFLHSATGNGKSHLMHAIGHAYLAAVPGAGVICMSAERFMFEFVAAMRAKDTHAFKTRLRSVDLLLIDDLQFIAGKDATQEEFFHTVNEIMAAGKRIVISADRCPQALDGVEPRIVSRLAGGLVADIKAPEPALRQAVLAHRLAEHPDTHVPTEVLEMLCARITGNVRDLEGALNRLIAYSALTETPIDMDFAVATLGEVLRGAQRRVTIDEIQKAVSTHFDLKPVDLVSARRARAVARPRQIAMYLAKRLTTRSLPEIGRKFGGRDHSTVIHAVRRIEELRDSDMDIDGAVRALMYQLEG